MSTTKEKETLAAVKAATRKAREERDAMPGAALASIMANQLDIADARVPPAPALPKTPTELERLRADEPQSSAQVIGHHKMPEAPPPPTAKAAS
eukprot:750987-Prymnesium_polylepis.1